MSGDVFSRVLGFDDSCRKDDDYGSQRSFSKQYDRNNYGRTVGSVAAKIAEAAFGSSESSRLRNHFFETETSILERLKMFSQQPIVKEAVIIAALMGLKASLWFVYRKASAEGLEIACFQSPYLASNTEKSSHYVAAFSYQSHRQ